MPKPSPSNGIEENLSEILEHLRRMDKRDKLRTWGGFFRSILHLIPIAILIWSIWFTYAHWDELLKEISQAAAEQSAAIMQNQGGDFGKQLQEQVQKVLGR